MSENTYLTALHGMEQIFPDLEKPMASFNRKDYPGFFARYYEDKLAVYEALEEGYDRSLDKEQYISNMADAVVKAGTDRVDASRGKQKKEAALLDLNLCIVVYILPSILKYKGASSKPLSDAIIQKWKEQFPKTNLSAAEYEEIESGFHKKWCYITTAACEMMGKPDDCYELTLLRGYRDTYLRRQPDGEKDVKWYYDVAPTIVKRINRMPDREEIYTGLWEQYIRPCIAMIEQGEQEACRDLYLKMVEDLQEKYFYQTTGA